MNAKKATVINILLFIAALVCFFIGLKLVRDAETDLSKIYLTVTNKISSVDQTDYSDPYTVKLKIKAKNSTQADWGYLDITTYVKNSGGKVIGTIDSSFGSYGSNSSFELKKGEEKELTATLKFGDYTPDRDGFLSTLYRTSFSDLSFEAEVTHGAYYN